MIHLLDAVSDKLVGYIDSSMEKNYREDVIEEGVDGTAVFTFTMPAKLPESVGVEDRMRLLVDHERPGAGFREFICYQAEQDRRSKRATALGSEIELDKLKIVNPGRYEGYTLRQYMEIGVDGIDWKVGDVVGVSFRTLSFDSYMGGFEFLQRIANHFDVELVFRIEVQNRRVVGRYVDAVRRQGERGGKEFVNAKDIINVKKTVHTQRFITALWVIMPDDEDGNPRPPVLVTDKDAFQRWNRKGQHLYGYHVIESEDTEMTVVRAEELGRTELNKRIASTVDYEVDAVDLAPILPHEKAYLGDYVTIKDDEFNPPLFATARIINVRRPSKRSEEGVPVRKTFVIGELVQISAAEQDAALKRMQERFERLIRDAERKAMEAEQAAGSILSSEELAALLATKADEEMLGDLVTRGELTDLEVATAERILEAIRNIDLSDFPTREEVQEEIDDVAEDIKDATAPNLLLNSLGYGHLDYWSVTSANQDIQTVRNNTLLRLGFGSGFFFPASNGERVLEQVVNVEPGKPLTLSWFLEKSAAGQFKIDILENALVTLTVPDFSDPTYSFRSSFVPYTPSSEQLAVRFTVAATTEATLTGLMLAEGNKPGKWGLARGELYNAYVRIDETGITVLRLDENGNVIGSTKITPEEFAGFYDENGSGNPEKIFWFNRDETLTKKLRATHEIALGQVKMIPIDSATNKGIAFVAQVPDD